MLSAAFHRLAAHPHQRLRLGLREVTDDERLKQIVNSCGFTNLALVDSNVPYAVPLSFSCVWGKVPTFYLHGATASRKTSAIAKNPNGCLTFVRSGTFVPPTDGRPCSSTYYYESVIAEGPIEVLTDPAEKEKGLRVIVAHYDPVTGPIPAATLERVVVLRLVAKYLAGKANLPK
jgi:nitroimidazol reductase NimA-like FMN-containing flavoprotein (pyridoxamine 5'-phosphate oxidase superfamily)